MKFEKINDNILKVFLSYDEISTWANLSDLLSDSNTARGSLIEILEKAESIVGFNTCNHKIKIYAQTLENGDYSFTFTKLIHIKKSVKKVKPKKVLKAKTAKSTFSVYKFNTLYDFEDFCFCLKNKKVSYLNRLCKSSSLYKYSDSYFLICDGINENHQSIALFYSIITEFAKFYTNRLAFKNTLQEYSTPVIKNNALIAGQKLF